jgi:putative ABC transport system substrate-binding protein
MLVCQINRRAFIAALGGAAAWPLVGRAQQVPPHIGVIDLSAPGTYSDRYFWTAFRDQLSALGYVEGKSIAIDFRWANNNPAKLPDLITDLVNRRVAVIVAISTLAGQAARSVTSEIPIVVPLMADPVDVGLVASLAHPGGNVTGLSTASAELSAKRLELLTEIIPSLSRVALLWNQEASPAFALTVRQTKDAARMLKISMQAFDIGAIGGVDAAFAAIADSRAQALIVALPTSRIDPSQVAEIVARHGLPAAYADKEYVRAGGLVSYGPNYPALFRRAAVYVDKILKGARPAELPAEEPNTFELAINLKTAKALGLEIPPQLLARADEVIE